MTDFSDVIRISTNYLDYMSLLDTFNKIMKEMKENEESNKKLAALMASMSFQDTSSKQITSSKKENTETEYDFRKYFERYSKRTIDNIIYS